MTKMTDIKTLVVDFVLHDADRGELSALASDLYAQESKLQFRPMLMWSNSGLFFTVEELAGLGCVPQDFLNILSYFDPLADIVVKAKHIALSETKWPTEFTWASAFYEYSNACDDAAMRLNVDPTLFRNAVTEILFLRIDAERMNAQTRMRIARSAFD